ncbi:ABC transporter permease [Paenibacillus albiflavus]|uniref:ABC transporter permease n=1 Tax=Paenibacillus albiflavus TaxID=2545760 RepID=A0A4R4EA43_9BACL|nr:ABC transporter permease [Paenibacillus albiflavus]TCZ74685.1 ABC transporter permease [Paenibacillus albiflavus]
MKAYLSIFKLRLNMGLQYRAAALAGVATQFFWGFMIIMVYEAFYTHSINEAPISLHQVITYVWLQQSFLSLIMLWFRDNELFHLITTGNIAYELCRPSSIYSFWYAKLLAQRISSAILRSFPILIVALFLPEPYRFAQPADVVTFILFAISLILGLFIVVSIAMLIYISVFITLSPMGSLLLFGVVGEFCAGMTIPIPLMPEWLQQIIYFLPFRWTADFPFRIYSGHIPSDEAMIGIVLQLIWLVLLIGLGKFLMSKVLRRVVVQGG